MTGQAVREGFKTQKVEGKNKKKVEVKEYYYEKGPLSENKATLSFYSTRKILFGLVFTESADKMDRGTTGVGRVIKLYFQ